MPTDHRDHKEREHPTPGIRRGQELERGTSRSCLSSPGCPCEVCFIGKNGLAHETPHRVEHFHPVLDRATQKSALRCPQGHLVETPRHNHAARLWTVRERWDR